MNRKKIILIATLMSCSLIGVIAMQVNWILHDYHVKEEQFNRQVGEAMVAVVDRLESREAYKMVSNSFITLNNDSIFSLLRKSTKEWTELEAPPQAPAAPDAPEIANQPDEIVNYTPPIPPDFPEQLEEDFHDEIKMEISHMGGRKITIRHNQHVITIGDSTNKAVIESKYGLDLKQRAKIESKVAMMQSMMNKMAFEFMYDDKDISKRISNQQLDTLLKYELECRGINTDFAFGVFKTPFKNVIATNNSAAKDDLLKSRYKVDLVPNDLFSNPVLLALHFPKSVSYVLSTMWLMLVSSTLFIIVIVLGFAYTMHVIFRQKKLSDIKNDFINNMTHEFKTPIATISLATDAVANPKIFENKESVSRYMRIIKEENQRMHKHVETILQMALLDKKDFSINKDELNIHELINKAVEQMQLLVENKEGTITSELHAQNFTIIGDTNLLFNSVMNLLDNANKYSPEKPQIKISTSNKGSYVSILVEDKGIGMTREVQKNIFEKFYRATTGNIHDVKGFGLGLSFVKAIAAAHKGDVRVVNSEPNKGTTMELLIPINLNELK